MEQYAGRADLPPKSFRVALLINNGTREQTDARLSEVEEFVKRHPDFPLDCYFSRTSGVFKNISEVRAALARMCIEHLPDFSADTLHNTYFVTHDADLISLPEGYFDKLNDAFLDPTVQAVGGGIEFATDSPLIKILYQIDDDLYMHDFNEGTAFPKMCGANSVFRASAYLQAKGFNLDFRRKVVTPIRAYLLKNLGRESVQYRGDISLQTSARRALECLNTGGIFAHQHDKFGEADDYAQQYLDHKPDELGMDTAEYGERCTFLGRQLTYLLQKKIFVSLASRSRRLKKSFRTRASDSMSYIVSEPKFQDDLKRFTETFSEICTRRGIDISISGDMEVEVRNYNLLSA